LFGILLLIIAVNEDLFFTSIDQVWAFKPTVQNNQNQEYLQEQDQSSNKQTFNEYMFLRQWGSEGNGTGEFNSPVDIAVDSLGYIYVADPSNDRIV